jgi:LysR family transcriptional regulator for metE and metH
VRINPTGLHKREYVARLKNKKYPLFFDCFINSLKQEMQFDNVLV